MSKITEVSKDEQDIREMMNLFISLSREDRAVLLANANAFRVRTEIEKEKQGKQ